ncbi:TPA: hypothetical protein RPW20_000720 [Campylobacter fetus subsp. venerealis]|nr:hypothetical protein [Campylobacter fetus subsp. venerealis]HDX6324075.1 hypothetical protein [Campylobacter fetus subsp. venerealis]
MSKFDINEIVYVKVTYGQGQSVIGCGIITEKKDDWYVVKFVDSDEKTLVNFMIEKEIHESDIYKLDNYEKMIDNLYLDLDWQLNLTKRYKQ